MKATIIRSLTNELVNDMVNNLISLTKEKGFLMRIEELNNAECHYLEMEDSIMATPREMTSYGEYKVSYVQIYGIIVLDGEIPSLYFDTDENPILIDNFLFEDILNVLQSITK